MASLFSTKPFELLAAEAIESNETSLRRVLGPYALVALGLGATVGGSLFLSPGFIAGRYAGSAAVLCYLVAGFLCFIGALCYAELASVMPISGAAYTYA